MVDPIRYVTDQYERRAGIVRSFFESESDRLASLCHSMARRFARGGRLIAFGAGAAATDAQHVSVEFVHPVIVGKRALPAVALINDGPTSLGFALEGGSSLFAQQLEVLARPEDIILGMVHGPADPGAGAVAAGLRAAEKEGCLTVWLGAPGLGDEQAGEHRFEVPSDDPIVVQEVHETLYHVLWELVHVYFEHKGLLEDRRAGSQHDTGASSFLYPFLSESESDLDSVRNDVASSIVKKAEDVIALRTSSMDPQGLVQTADAIAERIRAGGKILAFGNGGSTTDAQDLVTDLMTPPHPVPAISLTNDAAVILAVGNDVGFENVFARQVIAYGAPEDVAVAVSTSGGSRNVLAAIEEARRRGLLTVGLSGYGGGRQAELCDHALTIDADYVPRLQEAQATQYHVLIGLLRDALAGRVDVDGI